MKKTTLSLIYGLIAFCLPLQFSYAGWVYTSAIPSTNTPYVSGYVNVLSYDSLTSKFNTTNSMVLPPAIPFYGFVYSNKLKRYITQTEVNASSAAAQARNYTPAQQASWQDNYDNTLYTWRQMDATGTGANLMIQGSTAVPALTLDACKMGMNEYTQMRITLNF